MQIITTGPLPTSSLVWRGRAGKLALTVVCKATFTLLPDTSPLAAVQVPLREHDEHTGLDPARWLREPADLVPYKVRGDVMLVGHAHAPLGAQVRRLPVRLSALGVEKTLEVCCDRRRTADGRVLEGAPFTRMPLGWDRAIGAPQNPAGIPPVQAPDRYGTVPIANLQWPDVFPEQGVPAGFAPIAPWWPGRREKLGRRGTTALPTSWHGATVPSDADDTLFQSAPPDQQPARIDLGGVIYLENMHPFYPRLSTRLARLLPHATVERPARPTELLALVPDTLWIDTDQAICTVTWRGCLAISRADEAGSVRVTWQPNDGFGEAGEATLPLKRGAVSGTPRPPPRGPVTSADDDDAGTGTVALSVRGAQLGALPFQPGAPLPAPRRFETRPAATEDDVGTGTVLGALARPGAALPFLAAPDDDAGTGTMPLSLPHAPPGARPAIPFQPGEGTPEIARPSGSAMRARREDDDAGTGTLAVPTAASEGAPMPAEPDVVERPAAVASPPQAPPMIGPPAISEMQAPAPETSPEPGGPIALPIDAYPLERCATIAASMGWQKKDKARILEQHALDAATWEQLTRHWEAEIVKETRAGKAELMRAYDAAYVAQIERERGPITAEEYAAIMIAQERGTADVLLHELGISRAVMVRVDRVWGHRVRDRSVAQELSAAVRAARAR